MIYKIIKNPIFFGVVIGLIMILLTYLNNKISKDKDNNTYSSYIKIFISSRFTNVFIFLRHSRVFLGGTEII